MKQFFYGVNNRKYWLIITLIICGVMFSYGYRRISRVNQTEAPPPINPVPSIPREFNPGDSLLDFKIERDRERSREVERIQSLLDKIGLSDQVRKEAEEELWRLTQATSKEHELENLLMAKGFKECMATIGRKMVSVAISGRIGPDDVKNIAITSAEVTGYRLDQIQILER
ncbi:MAG: SpoIIIAH-like family protein [Firmicutes bacterium]|nr:SpoIIIAH-like family protein [Bacillota bacterium]